jgi:hypothetical protein
MTTIVAYGGVGLQEDFIGEVSDEGDGRLRNGFAQERGRYAVLRRTGVSQGCDTGTPTFDTGTGTFMCRKKLSR